MICVVIKVHSVVYTKDASVRCSDWPVDSENIEPLAPNLQMVQKLRYVHYHDGYCV